MSNFGWEPYFRKRLKKVGKDRMSSDAWELVDDAMTRIEELEIELKKERQCNFGGEYGRCILEKNHDGGHDLDIR